MRYEILSNLACPAGCPTGLDPYPDEEADRAMINGVLACPECQAKYPVVGGIARLLPLHLDSPEIAPVVADDSAEMKRSEMAARDAQADDYDKMRVLALFGKIEIPVTLAQMNLRRNDVLLEAGCGTGRMTPIFASRCQSVVAVDFSFESLRRCQAKLKRAGITNVDLMQADVCALPFPDESFPKLVSCQVLEHLPTPESRDRMISELARVTETGGSVVLSAYQHSLFTRLFGKKEGQHDGGISYYRFTRPELHALLSRHFEMRGMTGALIYHYLARCEKKDFSTQTI